MSSNKISPRDGVELASGDLHTAGVDNGNVTRRLILFDFWCKRLRREVRDNAGGFSGKYTCAFRASSIIDTGGRKISQALQSWKHWCRQRSTSDLHAVWVRLGGLPLFPYSGIINSYQVPDIYSDDMNSI